MTAPRREDPAVEALAAHWWQSRGMTHGSPDRCSCGAETLPLPGDEDASVRRARAFAEHQAAALREHGVTLPADRKPDERRAADLVAGEVWSWLNRHDAPWSPSDATVSDLAFRVAQGLAADREPERAGNATRPGYDFRGRPSTAMSRGDRS